MSDLLRLLALWRPWFGWIAAAIAVALVATLADVGLMAVSGWFVAAMAVAGATATPLNYFTPAALIRALAILRTGGRWVERVVGHEATLRLLSGTRADLFARLEPLAPAALDDLRSGEVLARLKTDVDRLELVFLRLVAPLAVALAVTVVVALLLARIAPALAIVFAAAAFLGGGLIPFLAARRTAPAAAASTDAAADLRARLIDALDGLATLKATGTAAPRLGDLVARHDRWVGLETRVATTARLAETGEASTIDLSVVAVLALGAPLVAAGRLAGPDLVGAAFAVLATAQAYAPLPAAFAALPATLAAARRLFALVDRRPVVVEPEAPPPPPDGVRLELSHVGVTLPGGFRPALADLDLVVEEGARVALLGESGAGKSTLFDLLVRFRDPDEGEIRLGGVALPRLTLADLHRRVVLVRQTPHVFASTVSANLRLAKPTASDAELRDVLAAVGLIERIDALPEGLDAPVGVAGTQLSGGEARRLAIARALLCDARVLLFDEPTEGLDPETATRVVDAILARARGRTVILATHRPEALARMDEVVVLAAGHRVGGPSATPRA